MTVPGPEPLFAKCETSTLRVIDANRNRAAEGLRVVEEYFRFVLEDPLLTRRCKQLRHDLRELLAGIPEHCLSVSRDTAADVGTDIGVDGEYVRLSGQHVAYSSWKRLQQALRVLEEYTKLVDPEVAVQIEALRYSSYTLERCFQISEDAHRKLAEARLYVLIDAGRGIDAMICLAQCLVEAGVHVLQLRDKSLSDERLVVAARELRRVTANQQTLFIVNDRPDIALLSRADGVHVGQEELGVKDVRAVVGPEMLVGVSTHSIQQARDAVIEGASYLGCGPTFPSRTKQFSEFAGLEFLEKTGAEIGLPAFAIGGIGPANISRVLATGARRIAVSNAVTTATQPELVVRELLTELNEFPFHASRAGCNSGNADAEE
ncbi:MAG: thiamine phosphate synthase [Planctomycetota bacterium]|nr:thiamine phosphate synthase [Planctomycetota bacterium]